MDDHNMSPVPFAVNTSPCDLARSATFGEQARPFIDAGWPVDGLLPGIPMGATIAPGSAVQEGTIGKVPGRYLGSRGWVGLTGSWGQGLSAVGLTPEDVSQWPTTQVCVTGRETPGLDIDIEDEELADAFEALAADWMEGCDKFTHARTRAHTGRRLIPFLPFAGPVGRWQVRFTLPQTGETIHTIEMIGDRFQWLGAGEHKSGNPYQWRAGVPSYNELPGIMEETSQPLRQLVIAKIEEMGGRLAGGMRGGASGPRVSVRDLDPLISHETLERLLQAVPDTPETVGGWDEGVRLLSSMRYVLGSAGRVCPSYVEAWADAYPGAVDGWAAARWNSFHDEVVTTEGTLLMWARDHAPADLAEEVRREIQLNVARRAFGSVQGEYDGGEGSVGPVDAAEPEPPEMEDADGLEPEVRLQRLIDRAMEQVVYFEPERAWVFVRERITYSRDAFNDSRLGRQVTDADLAVRLAQWDGEGRRPTPMSAHAILLPKAHEMKRVVKARTYAFGDEPLVRLNMTGVGMPYLNTAMPSALTPWPGTVTDEDVAPFLAHAERLLPGRDEREIVLSWMAWVLQNPRGKIRWSPVLKGPQGHGKDTLFKPLAEGVGLQNFEEVRPDKLGEKFTSFYERRIILVTEMSNSDRHNVYERIKAAITGSAAGYLWVERKGKDPYPTLDRCAWVILTNHDDAISMAADDRRFYVAETAVGDPPEREYFDSLYGWLEANGGEGYRKAASWLLQRDASAITPNRPPAATEAKNEMIWNNLPIFAKWFAEQLADRSTMWGKRTILSVGEVQKWMDANGHLAPAKVAHHYHPRMVREALKAAGWHEYPTRLDVDRHKERATFRVWTAEKTTNDRTRKSIVARLRSEMAAMSGASPFDVVDPTDDTGVGSF
jgi:hypothetical protein